MANNLKKTGSKTDLEPASFPPTGNHFFRYLKLEKKSYINEIVTDLLRKESTLTVRGFMKCNLRESL